MAAQRNAPQYARFSALKFKPLQGLRRVLQFGVVWLFHALASRLPLRVSQRMGRWTAWLSYPFIRRDRAICAYQLELAFPELDAAARKRLARRVFANLGMTLWETLAMSRIHTETRHWLHLENEEVLRAAYAKGRGVILINGHMANWELICVALERMRLPSQVVGRTIANLRLNELIVRNRESQYVRVVQRGSRESPRQLLTGLKQGDVLMVVIDHDVDVPGVFVDFFGIPANTPRVAAALALRHGVPVVSGFGRRRPDGSHTIRYELIPPPENLSDGRQGVREYTQVFSDAMEAHIRACPEQWTWNHRRWKRRPQETGDKTRGGA